MIEITYADMFLFVVILTLLGLWVKERLESVRTKLISMAVIEDLYSGEAELYHNGEQVMIRKVDKNV